MADSTMLGGVVAQHGAETTGRPGEDTYSSEEGYDNSPEGIMQCINDIREKLDALEKAVTGEEGGEATSPATGTDTGAEVPEPTPTDEEIVAGLAPKKKPLFGGMMGR